MRHRVQTAIATLRAAEWMPMSIHESGALAWLDDFLYLPEVLYVIILVWLIFSGPGRYSIDGLIARRVGVAGIEGAPRPASTR